MGLYLACCQKISKSLEFHRRKEKQILQKSA